MSPVTQNLDSLAKIAARRSREEGVLASGFNELNYSG